MSMTKRQRNEILELARTMARESASAVAHSLGEECDYCEENEDDPRSQEEHEERHDNALEELTLLLDSLVTK